ncbi:Activating signal cointegrator 1 complex subunit 1 [Plecturocebus cupreus]
MLARMVSISRHDPPSLASQGAGIIDSLTLLLRLEYSGVISAHCNLRLLDSGDHPTSAPQIAGITGIAASLPKAKPAPPMTSNGSRKEL